MIYRFHSFAEPNLEAIQFYESRSAGLGGDYLLEFEQVMQRVIETPHRPRIERKPDIRAVSLKRFPYSIVYRELDDLFQVLAVSHKRRRPGYWSGRF